MASWEPCEGELELDSAGDSDNEYAEDDKLAAGNHAAENGPNDYISVFRSSSLWILIRDSRRAPDVLVLRTARSKWNSVTLNGEFAALWFFLLTKDGSEERDPVTLPEWLSLCFDYRQNFGFAPKMIELGRLPGMTAFNCLGEWTWSDKGRWRCANKSTHKRIIDVCVFRKTVTGWSKRATRGFQSDYEDRSRQWEDHKASGQATEKRESLRGRGAGRGRGCKRTVKKNHGRAATDLHCAGVGLLLGSNTRSTATRGGASGPLVATNPTAMTDPVSGRIVSP